jgi:phosphonopyruvate decarboxylase
MLSGREIMDALAEKGFGPYAGTPCSLLQPLISYAVQRERSAFIMAANEGEAVAIAAGLWLGGKRPVVLFQNSGLGNAVNPIASLCRPFRIPILFFCSWRGEPGKPDEPQHELMGRITPSLFGNLEVGHTVLRPSLDDFIANLDQAANAMNESGLPQAFIVPKGSVEKVEVEFTDPLITPAPAGTIKRSANLAAPPISRVQALEHIRRDKADQFLIATTGKTGRELYEMHDREDQFYMVGSMGCAPSLALGAAIGRPGRHFTVIDGDGALLMRMESLATIGQYHPPNLTHVVLDNEKHDSTGGQPTLSRGIDFSAIAAACGYASATDCGTEEEFVGALKGGGRSNGPHFIRMKIGAGSKEGLGRPGIKPHEVARRFRAALDRA